MDSQRSNSNKQIYPKEYEKSKTRKLNVKHDANKTRGIQWLSKTMTTQGGQIDRQITENVKTGETNSEDQVWERGIAGKCLEVKSLAGK